MKNLILLLCLLYSCHLCGQDPHFSNYQNNPLGLNPALSGQINNYSNRVQISTRSQWISVLGSSHFKTIQVAFDKRICSPIGGDFFAFGLNVLADERGMFPLRRAEGMLTASYIKQLSQNRYSRRSYLSVGVEGGLIHHRLGQDGQTFDEQFDDPTSPGEIFDRYSFSMMDYGAGFSFFTAADKPTGFNLRFGAAASHLTKPTYKFLESGGTTEARLQTLFMFRAGVTIPIFGQSAISIQCIVQDQKPFQQLFAGANLIFELDRYSWFTVGAAWRQVQGANNIIADAWIPSMSFIKGHISFNLSYDANISPLRQASKSYGAIELSAAFLFGDNGCKLIICPH